MAEKLNHFVEKHQGFSEDEFTSRFPYPFLVVEVPGDDNPDALRHAFSTATSHPTLAELERESETIPMVFAIHREGGSSVSMITIGRTRISDIFLDHPSISKLHAYFRQDGEGGGFTITDAGSTNGTTINGRQLLAKESIAVGDGDEIIFADYLRGVFHTAASLFTCHIKAKQEG